MRIKKFNEDFNPDLDPFNEERDDDELVKPDLLYDDDMLVNQLYLPMEKIMGKIESGEIYLPDSLPEIATDTLYHVIYALYGEEGKEFFDKAMKKDWES